MSTPSPTIAPPPSSIAKDVSPTLRRADPLAYNPSTEIPSLSGKVFLITGANSGIGKHTALELSRHNPAQIWIAARTPVTGKEVVAEIKKTAPDVDARFVELDLTSFESVKGAARTVVGVAERLDVLVLNAGIMGGHPGVTAEGYEKQFGTNHVGHALLLKLLTPLLLKTAETNNKNNSGNSNHALPRIISVSSSGHQNALPEGGIAFSTLNTPQLDLTGVSKYCQSKLANVVYARQFAARYPQLVSIAIHPGHVATQLFSKGAEGGGKEIEYLAKELSPKLCVELDEGIKNLCWAATADEVETGRYYEPVGVLGRGSELSRDEEFGGKLWRWTEGVLEGESI